MRPETEDEGLIWDACVALQRAMAFVEDCTRQSFAGNLEKRSAVERQLQILGEACSRTTEPFRLRNPDVPWRRLIRLRHTLAHEYGEHLFESVWEAVRTDLPQIQTVLEQCLPLPVRERLSREN